MKFLSFRPTARQVTIVAALLASPWLMLPKGADAAPAKAPSAAEAAYRQERAVCLSGRSNQDRATCLKEASAALAEARRPGSQGSGDPASLQDNALRRCRVFAAAEREQCMRMARGEGKVSGSVSGGGQLKEITTVVPSGTSSAQPTPPAASSPGGERR